MLGVGRTIIIADGWIHEPICGAPKHAMKMTSHAMMWLGTLD